MFLALAPAMPLAAVLSTSGSIDSNVTLLLGYLANAGCLALFLELRSRRLERPQDRS
jgi:hypothetical protein